MNTCANNISWEINNEHTVGNKIYFTFNPVQIPNLSRKQKLDYMKY